ncbi:coiled-coil domain-containing protein 1-like [Macadamia integrifolia]|uniref:coiled-coil domain-containing protein 1-like n=1 Tax=Macadamia integrifolia TaxID=60698 RepID=UPI001C4EFAF9|nr:coiled-coil domain-containing protein 1-like [Macadamia integrifolia]
MDPDTPIHSSTGLVHSSTRSVNLIDGKEESQIDPTTLVVPTIEDVMLDMIRAMVVLTIGEMISDEIHLIHIGGESDSDDSDTEIVNAIRRNVPDVDPTDIILPIFPSNDDSEEEEDRNEYHLIHIGGENDSDTEEICVIVNAIRGNVPDGDPTYIIRPIFPSDNDSEEEEYEDEDIEGDQESGNEDLEGDLVEKDKENEDLEEEFGEENEDNQDSESAYFEFEFEEDNEEENPSCDNVLYLLNQMCEDMLVTEKVLRKVAVRQETV